VELVGSWAEQCCRCCGKRASPRKCGGPHGFVLGREANNFKASQPTQVLSVKSQLLREHVLAVCTDLHDVERKIEEN
jgi:hypothetical protein